MYGEKTEEAEELKLDLVDVKEMYKAQVYIYIRCFVCFYYVIHATQSPSSNINQ
jgi:hypothetical protein